MNIAFRLDWLGSGRNAPQYCGGVLSLSALVDRCSTSNVYIDKHSGALMLKPQAESWIPLSGFLGDTAQCEQVDCGAVKFIVVHSTPATLQTAMQFPENCGLCMLLYTPSVVGVSEPLLDLDVGSITLHFFTDGRVTSTYVDHRFSGMQNNIVRLFFFPLANNVLAVRTDNEGVNIITSDAVLPAYQLKLKAYTRLRFAVSRLTYPQNGVFLTPTLTFPREPEEGEHVAIKEVGEVFGRGGYVLTARANDGSSWDGTREYRIRADLLSSEVHSTPILRRVTVLLAKDYTPEIPDLTDISDLVRSARLVNGEKLELELCRSSDNPSWADGLHNRLISVEIDSKPVFVGLTEGVSATAWKLYKLTAQPLTKVLAAPCLTNKLCFDGVSHTEAIKQLCLSTGMLTEADIEVDEDDTKLPDTHSADQNADNDSELTTKPFDTPEQWIKRICEQTGWRFHFGYSHYDGRPVLRYYDPLSFDPEDVLYVLSAVTDSTTDGKIFELSWDYQAPEANIIAVIGKKEEGTYHAAVYEDKASIDPSLPPEERPDNWLGYKLPLVLTFESVCPVEWLKALAVRLGVEVSQVRRVATVESDWLTSTRPLWINDIVELRGLELDEPRFRVVEVDSVEFVRPRPRIRFRAVQLKEVHSIWI